MEAPPETAIMEGLIEKSTIIKEVNVKEEMDENEVFCKPGLFTLPTGTVEGCCVPAATVDDPLEIATKEYPYVKEAAEVKEEITFEDAVEEKDELFNEHDFSSLPAGMVQIKQEKRPSGKEMEAAALGMFPMYLMMQ
ncbi:uncharacterized protein LOC143023758 [Oratosquilla oratoria]|uniref:uncharacterized protein LOC143023758 n=1 Tax=Oratosquilla oratoria TaxID=337810 RepID=UPI003F777738